MKFQHPEIIFFDCTVMFFKNEVSSSNAVQDIRENVVTSVCKMHSVKFNVVKANGWSILTPPACASSENDPYRESC